VNAGRRARSARLTRELCGDGASTDAVASRALARPKPYLSDFGRLKVPNSGKPEFGAVENDFTRRRKLSEAQMHRPAIRQEALKAVHICFRTHRYKA